MKSKLRLLSLSVILSALTCATASAKSSDSYDWIIRSRALFVKTDTTSKVSTLGGHVATSSDQVPELDFTRFFAPNIAAELILATTQHNVELNGSSAAAKTGLGSVRLLPPTLTLQYHANPTGTFRPYAGAGLNYTFFYGAKTGGTATSIKYQDHLGYALQLGFDYMIDERFGINFDVKKIFLKTNVQVNNAVTAQVRLDPWLIGGGVSYRF
ncbi:MAG: OmpW family protein [Rickettsiales bacterium]|nr:OmpW family protein [Rickettsiales bacterium]